MRTSLLILLSINCISFGQQNDLSEMNLYGRIQSVETELFMITNQPNFYSKEIFYFNESGFKTSSINFQKDTSIYSANIWILDSNNLIKSRIYFKSTDYDTIYYSYHYDGINIINVVNVHRPENYSLFQYNNQNKQISSIEFLEGKLYQKTETIIGDGPEPDTLNEYNHNGKLIRQTIFLTDPESDSIVFVECTKHDTSKVFMMKDSLGNIIRISRYEGTEEKNSTLFEFVYDEQGNWIEQKQINNGAITFVWRRRIKYFEN